MSQVSLDTAGDVSGALDVPITSSGSDDYAYSETEAQQVYFLRSVTPLCQLPPNCERVTGAIGVEKTKSPGGRQVPFQVPAPPFSSCMNLGRFLTLFDPQFPQMENVAIRKTSR